jgi:hypothetical protein
MKLGSINASVRTSAHERVRCAMNAQELAHRLEIVTGRRYWRAGSGYLWPCARCARISDVGGHT